MSESKLSAFGSQTSLSPSIFSPTSYSVVGEHGMDSRNMYHVFTMLIARILDSQACSAAERPLEFSQFEYFEKEFVSLLFESLLKYISRLACTTRKLSLIASRSKPIILDLVQAIRNGNRGMPMNWLNLLACQSRLENAPLMETNAMLSMDENTNLVKDGLPPLPPHHTYKSTPVLVSRTLNQSRIILKTAAEKLRLEKNLRHLMQMSHSGHSRINAYTSGSFSFLQESNQPQLKRFHPS